MKNVILLDWKGNVSLSNPEVIKRHQSYGESLGALNPEKDSNLIVISLGNENRKISSKNFTLFQISSSKGNIFKFIWSCRKIIRKELGHADALVCGDPWDTFLVARILQIFLGQSIPIQVQLHADISTSEFATSGPRYFIRSLIQGQAFKSAQQIRVVSESIGKYIVDKFKVPETKILVIPVPITLTIKPRKAANRITKKVGFVGRLHKERGTNLLVEIVSILERNRQDFELVVIGAGPEQEKLHDSITKVIGISRIKFEGWLDQKEVADILSSLDVYLSLAPLESYGLGIREALSTGLPVIAVKSTGVTELSNKINSSLIQVISNPLIESEVIRAYKSALQQREVPHKTPLFDNDSEAIISSLTRSWIRLIQEED